MDHTETTETYLLDVTADDPTRTPATESTIVHIKPGHLRKLVTWAKMRFMPNHPKQHAKHHKILPTYTTDAMDEDDNFDTDEWSHGDFNFQ